MWVFLQLQIKANFLCIFCVKVYSNVIIWKPKKCFPSYIIVVNTIMAIRTFTICPTVFDLISRRTRSISHFPCQSSAVYQPSPARMICPKLRIQL